MQVTSLTSYGFGHDVALDVLGVVSRGYLSYIFYRKLQICSYLRDRYWSNKRLLLARHPFLGLVPYKRRSSARLETLNTVTASRWDENWLF